MVLTCQWSLVTSVHDLAGLRRRGETLQPQFSPSQKGKNSFPSLWHTLHDFRTSSFDSSLNVKNMRLWGGIYIKSLLFILLKYIRNVFLLISQIYGLWEDWIQENEHSQNFSSSVLQGKKADRNNSTSAIPAGFGMGAANPDLCPDDCYTTALYWFSLLLCVSGERWHDLFFPARRTPLGEMAFIAWQHRTTYTSPLGAGGAL